MRRFFTLVLPAVCLACIMFVGCLEDEDISFSISQSSDLHLSTSEQTVSVDVFAPGSWSVYIDADWLAIDLYMSSFLLKVEENSIAAQRTAIVSVICGSEVRSFKIVQTADEEEFKVSAYVDGEAGEVIENSKTYSADAHGQSYSFIIESNWPDNLPPCEIVCEEEWITYSIDNNIANIEVAPDYDCKIRRGSVTFVSPSGEKDITVFFEQDYLELVENIVFTAPDQISYNIVGGNVERDENGDLVKVVYYTGLYDSKELKNHAWNSFMQLNEAFYDTLPVRRGNPGRGPIFTVSDPEETITYSEYTATYFYNLLGGKPIKAGGKYIICVCKKSSAEKWDLSAPFYAVEFTVPEEDGAPITAQPPVFEEEEE